MDYFDIVNKIWHSIPVSDDEIQALIQWLGTDEGKDHFKTDIIEKWDGYPDEGEIDYDYFLHKIHARKNLRAKSLRRTLYRRTYWIAAAILLFIAGATFLMYPKELGQPYNITYDGNFGSPNKAILTLADGTVIEMDEYSDKMLEEGGSVVNVGTGELIYTETDAEEEPVYHEIYVPTGGEYKLNLNDGTEIWLNSQTRIKYPNKFTSGERKVNLTGEAYFKVAHDTSRSFIVESDGQQISVLGTEFNVNSYEGDQETFTTLASGSVKITSTSGGSTILKPGEQSVLDRETGKMAVREVDVAHMRAWRAGYIVIEDQTLEQVMQKLSRWYGIEYTIRSGAPSDLIFMGVIPKHDLEKTLNRLEKITNLKIELHGNRITVKK